MTTIGIANKRTIVYQKFDRSLEWYENMPTENWLILVVINNKNKTDLFEISRRVINNNVCYVCCVDKQGELLHDIIDEDIVIREVEVENNYLPFNIITTWHSDIENTIWYAIYTAHNEAMNIDTIFCLDAGENDSKEELDNLIKRFTQGYIPPGN